MIKAVSLDVGGTLIAATPSVGAIYAQIAQKHDVAIDADFLDARFSAAWKKHKALQLHQDKTWWKSVVTDGSPYQFKNPSKFFSDLYHHFENPSAWIVFADVRPALEELRKRGLRLNIASNWDSRLPALLSALGLDHYFDQKIISFEVGFSKPHPTFFEHVRKRVGVNPDEILHVGDDVREDVGGAQAAGMKTLLINRRKEEAANQCMGVISRLSGIFDFLV